MHADTLSLFTAISNMLLPLVLFIRIKLEVWLGPFYKNQSRMSLALSGIHKCLKFFESLTLFCIESILGNLF